MGGIGSPKMTIIKANTEIRNLLILDNNADQCNIELRPKGIIIGFRALLDSYALIIPYYKLACLKGEANTYTLHRDHYFVKVRADRTAAQKFIVKMLACKARYSTPFDQ